MTSSLLRRMGVARAATAAFAAIALATLGAAMASCSSSADSATFAGSEDGGGTDAIVGSDASGDAGQFDSGPQAPPSLVVAHGSPDLFDFRICFAKSASPDGSAATVMAAPAWPDDEAGPMPLANYSGVPLGGGTRIPALGAMPRTFVLHLVRAQVLARAGLSATPCDELICSHGGCLTEKLDYVALPPIDATSAHLAPAATYLLAITGCMPGNTSPGATCGAAYNGTTGNLNAKAMLLDVKRSADSIGLQVAHAATGVGRVTATVDTLADAGTIAAIFGDVAPQAVAFIPKPTFAAYASTRITLHVTAPPSDAGADAATSGPTLALSLSEIQKATAPSLLPDAFYEQDSSFVFVVLGDPSPGVEQVFVGDGGANARYDGHGLHVIAIPTAPLRARDGGTF